MFEATLKRVVKRSGVDEEVVRSIVQSGILEDIPANVTLRGIYLMYKGERSKLNG